MTFDCECSAAVAVEERTIKCVVWDLDDTLWQGTLLEGDTLVLTAGVKDVIEELDNRGILQSIASKNDYNLAWEKLSEFGLDAYFLFPQINWENKSDSLKAIANGLGLGIDAFAFIDDQPFERDEVQYFLPEVTVIAAVHLDCLLQMPTMQPRFITNESKLRRQMYQADIQRKQSEADFPGAREEFLETLDMRVTIRVACELDLRRAEELTIRTNQLNTTGRPYSYEELKAVLNSSEFLLLVVVLDDRYGTSGTIGLALIEQKTDIWVVKLLIMSCRVMTRGIGTLIMSYILQSARDKGVKLLAEFVENDRNRMMYITYKFNGFFEVSRQDRSILLEHDLAKIRPYPYFVAVQSATSELAPQ